jgi:hypothetical protein
VIETADHQRAKHQQRDEIHPQPLSDEERQLPMNRMANKRKISADMRGL